ncbi:phosphate-starvation-inducible PsiE family protein [Halocatena pleomorpha]|uniref:Phosphate-starvation-inducible PsiE family protein n=1 Tax=Halocatena pleomorpha TaxID=1785090 RepID=A0A3P3R9G0_9EURY|nr:phosphate-starvation-inducible PsiE family protein [Halocatena pleomorpha]RRJ29579.1 hypothetical protein EIK79_13175 [Halocatena pleomorpha]
MTDDESDSHGGDITATEVKSRVSHISGRTILWTEQFVHITEVAAAIVFATLFAIGVFDLARQIIQATLTGRIAKPLVVIGFLDIGLLLLVIIEVYQTVIAYMKGSETREIVRLVIYAGVIAMVRKSIIFRTGAYATTQNALFAAAAYTVIILGLVGLLHAERVTEQ